LEAVGEALIRQHFDELEKAFPTSKLKLKKDEDGRWLVTGDIHFKASFKEESEIEDTYSVQLSLPSDYPQSPPKALEIGERIPRDIDHHIFPATGELCLGAPLEVRRRFLNLPSLLHFVNDLLVPFLYAFSYQERFGERPWGELSHGGRGVLEYYQEAFHTDNLKVVLRLLKTLADDSYRGHHPCPCASGDILRRCHGKQLRDFMQLQSAEVFLVEAETILCSLNKEERRQISASEIPNKLLARIKKEVRNRDAQNKVEHN